MEKQQAEAQATPPRDEPSTPRRSSRLHKPIDYQKANSTVSEFTNRCLRLSHHGYRV